MREPFRRDLRFRGRTLWRQLYSGACSLSRGRFVESNRIPNGPFIEESEVDPMAGSK
jgi:hypothetical protein